MKIQFISQNFKQFMISSSEQSLPPMKNFFDTQIVVSGLQAFGNINILHVYCSTNHWSSPAKLKEFLFFLGERT